MPKKTLLITLGDANGLGPELACRLFGEDIFIAAKRPIIMIGSAASLLMHTETAWDGSFLGDYRVSE